MAFDGNGNWIPEFSAKEDKNAGVKILASRFDDVFQQDLKESFEKCLTNDGQSRPLSDFNFNNHKGINVADPETENDVVNLRTTNNMCLHKTGEETATGVKTFQDGIKSKTPSSATDNSTNVATTQWVNNARRVIIHWAMPDYSSPTSISTGASFTAQQDGFLYVRGREGNYVDGLVTTSNGQVIYRNWPGGGYASSTSGLIPIPKGTTVTFKDIDEARFYPLLGFK